ncbi:glyoxalase superfamily protein [Rhizobium rhizogenes]
MHTYRDAKRMAKILESYLHEKNVDISHGESLNLIAKQFGLEDWNVLSAKIKRAEASDARRMQALQSWDFMGEHPTEFDYGVDDNARGSGRRAAVIRYTRSPFTRYSNTARVFGTLMQHIAAEPYHGKRIEIRVDLATEHVSHGATVWARIDKSPGHKLTFENLKHHPNGWLFGDNGWTSRRIIMDIPPEGVSLYFGFFLKGTGTVWATNFELNIVDNSIPLTTQFRDQGPHERAWTRPQNLDFSTVVDLIQ